MPDSMLVAIVASAVALFVVNRRTVAAPRLLLGGIFISLSIVAMNHIGLLRRRLIPGMVRYWSPPRRQGCLEVGDEEQEFDPPAVPGEGGLVERVGLSSIRKRVALFGSEVRS